jgi:predicted RecB family endonuclease
VTLAEIAFQQKKLERRYGVEGRVAGKYVEAGFHVRMHVQTRHGKVSFVAIKGSEKYAVDVIVEKRTINKTDVETLVSKAKSLGARPVLVLYGAGPKLSEEALATVKESGVVVKRIRD